MAIIHANKTLYDLFIIDDHLDEFSILLWWFHAHKDFGSKIEYGFNKNFISVVKDIKNCSNQVLPWFHFEILRRRKDVREAFCTPDLDVNKYMYWWIKYGRKEYNLPPWFGWSSQAPFKQESLKIFNSQLPVFHHDILINRLDIQNEVVDSKLNLKKYLKWWENHGAQEYEAPIYFGWDEEVLKNHFSESIRLIEHESKRLYESCCSFPNISLENELVNSKSTNHNLQDIGINIIGFPKGQLGVGEDSRMIASSLESQNIPFCLVQANKNVNFSNLDPLFENKVTSELKYKTSIFCLPGFDTNLSILENPKLLAADYNILFPPWELSHWPIEMEFVLDWFDEIWVASEHIRKGLPSRILESKIVKVMPMGVKVYNDKTKSREDFGLSEKSFLLFQTFDCNSFIDRKNPYTAIEAFLALAEMNKDIEMIIKVSNGQSQPDQMSKLMRLCNQNKRIKIIDEVMDKPNLHNLYSLIDAYISPHRAEGFGRNIAECMLLGKPCVITGYSGNMEFCNDRNSYLISYDLVPLSRWDYLFASKDQFWAAPSLQDTFEAIRNLISDKNMAKEKGKLAKTQIVSKYSPLIVGEKYSSRLRTIFETIISSK